MEDENPVPLLWNNVVVSKPRVPGTFVLAEIGAAKSYSSRAAAASALLDPFKPMVEIETTQLGATSSLPPATWTRVGKCGWPATMSALSSS